MTEAITKWLGEAFHNPYLTTTVISMIPMIEVRGGITVGINLGLTPWLAWLLSCAGALVVSPFLLLCLHPLLNLLKRVRFFRFFAEAVEDVFKDKANKIERDAAGEGKRVKWRKTLGVFLFVAVPLPLTGVWTGSAVAAFLDLDWKYSFPAIAVGNFVSGVLILLLNLALGEYSPLILLILMGFVVISVVTLVTTIVLKYRKKIKKQTSPQQAEDIQKQQ